MTRRGAPILLAATALLAAAFMSVAPASPAGADCGGGTVISGGNASGSGWCATSQPPRQNDLTVDQLWNAYCAPYTRPYRGVVTIDTVVTNPDGSQSVTSETFIDRVSFEYEYDHPGDTTDPVFLQIQFDFMVLMGWDPTSVVQHYSVICTGHEVNWRSGITEDDGAVHFTVVDPVPVEVLRDRALAKIRFDPPVIGSAPPATRSVVNLSNWLWVDTSWATLSDSDAQGAVSVTVTARPVDVTWTFDDNRSRAFAGRGEVVCDGPGTPWRDGLDDDASDCQYLFRYPSAWNPDGVFHGGAEVRWELTWALNGVDQGAFGEMTRASAFDVRVVEIQTVGASG